MSGLSAATAQRQFGTRRSLPSGSPTSRQHPCVKQPRDLAAGLHSALRRRRMPAVPGGTAQWVADRVGVEVTTDLLDRDYSRWVGASRESVVSQWDWVDNAPGVEPLLQVRGRAVRGLADAASAIPKRRQRTPAWAGMPGAAAGLIRRRVLRRVPFDAGRGPGTFPQDIGCVRRRPHAPRTGAGGRRTGSPRRCHCRRAR